VKIFGADLARTGPDNETQEWTLVHLDPSGSVQAVHHPSSLGGLIAEMSELAEDDPFLLGVNIPVAIPTKASRTRPFESLIRKKFGIRIQPGGRNAPKSGEGAVTGEKLLAGLAGAGLACLTYPDKNRTTSALAEIHPGPTLKSLLWIGSELGKNLSQAEKESLCRSYQSPAYHPGLGRRKREWTEFLPALDLLLRTLSKQPGYDFRPTAKLLTAIGGEKDFIRAVSIFDACLIAGTARRHMESPEACAFCGERENGYTILPSDDFLRRMLIDPPAAGKKKLFPQATLKESLRGVADIRSLDLLEVKGKPKNIQAIFHELPCYEFENVDEMLWWKRCRHVDGPTLPVEGLTELSVQVEGDTRRPLVLQRSRHTALSFRFHPPAAWRSLMQPRDNKVYQFQILRASYEA
jgi:hypothetical protein